MTPERWEKVGSLYQAAMELRPQERAAFLAEECGEDKSLLREVESLIEAEDGAGSFLAAGAMNDAAKLLSKKKTFSFAGRLIDRYQILSRIGSGGMGDVYLAQDTRLKRQVAIKFLPNYVAQDQSRLRRFEQEAQAASALNHPNILTIYEISEVDTTRFIVTEFIDGVTLRQHMAQSQMDVFEAVNVAIDVASALVAAHKVKIVHRDIKPENIMIRRDDGLVKVLDFGLAKATKNVRVSGATDPEAQTIAMVNTAPGLVLGTVAYMSPEQARGLIVDERSDIWSVGAVLYEMIAGKPPFAGVSANEIISEILGRGQLTPLSRFPVDLPDELDRIVCKALTKDREERYQTIKDFRIDLKRLRQRLQIQPDIAGRAAAIEPALVEDTPVSTDERVRVATVSAPQSTSSAEYIVTEIKRHKRGLLLALLLVVVATASIGYWLRKSLTTSTPFAPAIKMTRLTSTGRVTNAAISPDGKYVVYAMEDGGQQALWLAQVAASGQNSILPAAAVRYWGITFSRDGNFVYYVRQKQGESNPSLYQAPALGGGTERKLVADVHSPITLSPDGRRLAFVRAYPASPGGDSLIVANEDGSDERVLLTRKQPNLLGYGGPSWSPNGEVIACASNSYSGSFYSNVIGVRVADGAEGPITSKRWAVARLGRISWLAGGEGLVATASEQPGNLTQIWYLSAAKNEARQLVNDLNGYSDLTPTSDSTALAALRTDRLLNIWVWSAESKTLKQITSGTGRDDGVFGLNWTPDGKIVYRTLASNSQNIWIIGADGTGNRQLLPPSGHNSSPAVTPDGRYLIWVAHRTGTGVAQLWRMEMDGGNPKQLTSAGGVWFPQLSPDGKWVVYGQSGSENVYHSLWRISIDGGEPVRLTNRPSWVPSVSPDGKLIVCNWLDETSGQWKLAILPVEGGEPIRIFNLPGVYNRSITWTPDGRGITFIRTSSGVSNLWIQRLEGGEPQQLTDFKDQRIINFAWSRDGKQLALSRGVVNSDVVLIEDFR